MMSEFVWILDLDKIIKDDRYVFVVRKIGSSNQKLL